MGSYLTTVPFTQIGVERSKARAMYAPELRSAALNAVVSR